ncbi:MAG TPA: Maf family protein [Candidatus Nitrosotalea sp.]|nr:Maf family protein [Candidatus Nitrosotalea sp.]
MRATRIVLASASPRRYELLRSLGLEVEVAATDYHEPPIANLIPSELALAHAAEKLRRAVLRSPPAEGVPILAADTVVDLAGVALGKPRDPAEAVSMLERLSGREHAVHTAFGVAAAGKPEPVLECATTRVRFYPLEPAEIAEYVATGEPFDKAGAYGIQGRAAALIEGIEGDFYTVMGLPLARFIRALRRLGFALPDTNDR